MKAATATALVALAVYVALAIPDLYWLDSGEFVAAAWTLGVAHPPGHPLAALWSRLFLALPLGGMGFRVALSQAVAGAAAVFALVQLTQRLLERMEIPIGAAGALAAAAGVVFGFSFGHAFQAVRPEVYALHAATALGACALALEGTRRSFAAAALLVGLGLCNHHLLALAGALPIFGLAIADRRLGARGWAVVITVGAVALGAYLYIPLRARAHPLVDWGHATGASQFFWLVSARAFQKAVHKAELGPLHMETMLEVGPLAFVCALGGAVALVRADRRTGLFVLAQIAVYFAASTLVGFEPENPDRRGYMAVGMGFVAVCAAVLPAALWRASRTQAPRASVAVAAVVGLVIAGGQLARGFSRFSLAGMDGAERIFTEILDEPPPRAVVSAGYFQTVFGLWYERAVAGARPDVTLEERHLPGIEPRATDPPTVYEYDLHLPAETWRAFVPAGFLYRLDGPRDFAAQDRLWDRLAPKLDLDERETRNYMVWTWYLAAHLRCDLGERAEGLLAADRVTALNGAETAEVQALRSHCGRP